MNDTCGVQITVDFLSTVLKWKRCRFPPLLSLELSEFLSQQTFRFWSDQFLSNMLSTAIAILSFAVLCQAATPFLPPFPQVVHAVIQNGTSYGEVYRDAESGLLGDYFLSLI